MFEFLKKIFSGSEGAGTSRSRPSEEELGLLTAEEQRFLRVLIEKKLISPEQVKDFLQFRTDRDQNGKPLLGNILMELNLITPEILAEILADNNIQYLDFCDVLVKKGYMSENQMEILEAEHEKSNRDVIHLISELGIMTKYNFCKIFEKNVPSFRLGDHLLNHKLITRESLENALKVQSANSLKDYLDVKKILPEKRLNEIKESLELGA